MPEIRFWAQGIFLDDVRGEITFKFNASDHEVLKQSFKEKFERTQGWCFVSLKPPKKPISTGHRSLMNRIHGHCSEIADQLNQLPGAHYTTDEIKAAIKRMAVGSRGYPTKMNIDGTEEPMSLKDVTQEQGLMLTAQIQDYADAHSLMLTEYDEEGKPVKTRYGVPVADRLQNPGIFVNKDYWRSKRNETNN